MTPYPQWLQLYQENQRLAFRYANSMQRHWPGGDFESVCLDALLHAARKYNPEKKTRFSTYAYIWLRKYTQQECKRLSGRATQAAFDVALSEELCDD